MCNKENKEEKNKSILSINQYQPQQQEWGDLWNKGLSSASLRQSERDSTWIKKVRLWTQMGGEKYKQ